MYTWSPGFEEGWPRLAVPLQGASTKLSVPMRNVLEMQSPGPPRLPGSASRGEIQQSLCLCFVLFLQDGSEAWRSVTLSGDFPTLAQLLSWPVPEEMSLVHYPFVLLTSTPTTQGSKGYVNCVNSLKWPLLVKPEAEKLGPKLWVPDSEGKRLQGPLFSAMRLYHKHPLSLLLPCCMLSHHPISSACVVMPQKTEIRELIWKTGEQDTDVCSYCYLMLLRNCLFLFPCPSNSSLGGEKDSSLRCKYVLVTT